MRADFYQLGGETVERSSEVALLLFRVAGLAQLVAAGVAQRLDPVADRRVRVVAQPRRRLHDVGVGVVYHPPGDSVVRQRLVLGHGHGSPFAARPVRRPRWSISCPS